MSSHSGIITGTNAWFQKKINLRPAKRGCHLVTDDVVQSVQELSKFKVGLFNVQIQHTSASLMLNENYDPDVREDMKMYLDRIVPETLNYKHRDEGADDMPAHIKAALTNTSLNIPITDGKLNLGTWQGIWLCEHRNNGGSRKLIVTINGVLK
ncbi:UPF0047 protein YjbQ-like protein [Dinothrombium tinctorium]|uniref:UPF0047 protein YjbQ-like protein n=1 Tax=Dinothrombium tinctorium TaxID=1965070 RepID=A0A3S3Q1E1_9ACAR|nr:UPF0047 protein YjbQ-like protein [Dinothrombium tinctorium]RWS12138.1 UPF0047 protein YjbQ-like protein [Dinothrombium tinctorium]RWS12172.1 UPF0047 protein YjbQ-like protein [Dinothrombium tinctorium]